MTDPLLDHIPPQSLEAEMAVLGAVMQWPEAFDAAAEHITADDFFRQEHRAMFAALVTMRQNGTPLDYVTVKNHLISSRSIESVGGESYIVDLVQSVPTPVHASHYARIVKAKAELRRLIHTGAELMRRAYDESNEAEIVVAECQKLLCSAVRPSAGSGSVAAELAVLGTHRPQDATIKTGLWAIDGHLGGVRAAKPWVIGGRTSMGKSSLVHQLALNAVLKQDAPTMYVTLEGDRQQIIDRMCCQWSQVPLENVMRGKHDGAGLRAVKEFQSLMATKPLFVYALPGVTMATLTPLVRRNVATRGVRLVIVDYIQRMGILPEYAHRKHEGVAYNSGALSNLSIECNVGMVMLSQLRRETEGTRPSLNDLRESGNIEEDAFVVVLLHKEKRESEEAEIIIAKNKAGPTCLERVAWQGAFSRFVDREELRDPPREVRQESFAQVGGDDVAPPF